MAPETARAETVKARIVVALGGASTLKPRKMTTSHETRMISIAFEIEGTDWAANSERTWAVSMARAAACDLRAVCISLCGERRWMALYTAFPACVLGVAFAGRRICPGQICSIPSATVS